ncbi:MAG TPA: adenosylcobalamin-dependent ribonucleoside-diphosphate reductase [Archaeoglobaceae archaeon]|nr:adenosylcobalamin-dependent ribonucleoside-diphosphate reductase [Archaeoglobaceae archaeon]
MNLHNSNFRISIAGRNEYRMSTDYLRRLATELGLKPGHKAITEEIEKASSSFCKGFLRGFFDADGSVQGTQRKISIQLSQSNLETLKAVQRMLLRLGIYSRIYKNRRGGKLVISNDNIVLFYELVGFGDRNKMKKIEKVLNSYRLNRERFIASVKELIPDGVEEVYDVRIPGINAFDANGFVVHNCGEQPLLPYESCNLGSINVANFVKNGSVDWEHLKEVVWTAVRFLDNVIDMNNYPIPEIKENTFANRKIGLGIMGFADLLFKLGIPYDSREGVEFGERLMSFIQEESHKASSALAEERGVFPNWKGSVWEKKGIKMRNATTTTIAPTGTISIIANCSSGIEPAYALAFRRMNILDGEEFFEINPVLENTLKRIGVFSDELISRIAETGSIQEIAEIPEELRRIFKCALEISPEWHVRMQAAFQKYTDNAVSKTINLPNHATRKDVEKAFLLAYDLGCKGITVYRDGSREEQVLATKKAEKKERKSIRPPTFLEPRPRPKITTGRTIETRTGCGALYVTINEDEHGIAEVFVQLGKSGGCAASQTEAMGRLISVALRSWLNPEALIRQLKGIRCPSIGFDDGEIVTSCADGVAKVLERYLKGEYTKIMVDLKGIKPLTEFVEEGGEEHVTKLIGGVCPECGNVLEYGEGCMTCKMCGFTKCG